MRKIIPLIAYVYDVSPTGNLTIMFNKPIIVPNIYLFDD